MRDPAFIYNRNTATREYPIALAPAFRPHRPPPIADVPTEPRHRPRTLALSLYTAKLGTERRD